MKKPTIIICLTILFGLTVKGQLNPIKNLQWSHGYEEPMNCFVLSWSKPDSSLTDTLIGYNIYRDDSLYTFTNDLFHSCNPCIGIVGEPFCDFLNFPINTYSGQFYIHVTAVYNYNHIESIYNDSIYNGGIYIGIKELYPYKALKVSTIIQDKSTIKIELNQIVENGTLIISSITGQIKRIITLKNQKNINISILNFNTGIYLLSLRASKENISCKMIIK